jgi:hypothetical protein
LRSFSGYLGDKTGKYWLVTIVGYIVNMLAVPALALAGNWPLAAGLIVAERTGRAIRKPSTDAMLSFAGHKLGRGWVFGLNEAFDQAGGTLGPLVISVVLFRHGSYRTGFALLLVSALLTIAIVFVASNLFPNPRELEAGHGLETKGFRALTGSIWLWALLSPPVSPNWVMGVLYEKSILILVIFSVALQLLSLLAFALAKRGD